MDTKKSIEENAPDNYEAAELAFAELAQEEKKEVLSVDERINRWVKKLQSGQANL